MGLRNRLKALVECTVFGHDPFETGSNQMARVFQSKDIGNKYQDLRVCTRCSTVYADAGELTVDELAEEKRIEEKNADFQSKVEKIKDELIKKMTQNQVDTSGKNALN